MTILIRRSTSSCDSSLRSTPSQMSRYQAWLAAERGLSFDSYEALRLWSVTDLDAFWASIWAFGALQSPTPHETALAEERMPGAVWFPGAQVNYARQVFRHADAAHAAGQPAIIAEGEGGEVETLDWPELRRRTASLALRLRALGVRRGDRIAAFLPNRPEAVIAFLATASLGAVWSVCAPDMGLRAVVERFRQIEPRVLIAADGVFYAGRATEHTDTIDELRRALPSVEHVLVVRTAYAARGIADALPLEGPVEDGGALAAFEPVWVPFDHPLWVLYSSGTTGLPKAIVHSQGGILLAALVNRLHADSGPSYEPDTLGDRFHWYSTTGWMMWNIQVNGLLGGTTICLFDGSPSGPKAAPDWSLLWRFAARHRVTFLGSGAHFFSMCLKAGLDFSQVGDLRALRALGSTASPLPAAVQTGLSERLAAAGLHEVWWLNSSGGTDICASFTTAVRDLPPVPGRMQCRPLGSAVEAWSEDGRAVVGEVGELVCTRPLPSMPIFFWGDRDGSRYRAAYFDHFPGVWRHGDWLRIEPDGTCEISGRSDATINRGGHRMGTSEIYAALEGIEDIADALVIDVEIQSGESRLLLFLQLKSIGALDSSLTDRAKAAVRRELSPRFVPDQIIEVEAVPRTLSAKRQELPIKRLFQGWPLVKAIDPAGMANPECLGAYLQLAQNFRDQLAQTV